jgi:radical SAM enzyme (TIGR01210 family)
MNRKHYIIPIFVPHKGCPHDCIFCNQKKITGNEKDITSYDVSSTIDDYLTTIDKINSFIEVSFFGGSFTGIPIKKQSELLGAAKNALDDKKINAIRLSTRPDYIDRDILENLKKYNVGIIEIGVQSLDEEVLKISERGHSPEDVYKASKLIREFGFKLGLQMMVGLPCDNIYKDIYTAEKIIDMKPDFVRIYPTLTIKDTYMEQMYRDGIYQPPSIDETVQICKKLYIMFTKSNIRIIRMGLQATDNINIGKDIIAGPFHPAFGEMVESAVLN